MGLLMLLALLAVVCLGLAWAWLSDDQPSPSTPVIAPVQIPGRN